MTLGSLEIALTRKHFLLTIPADQTHQINRQGLIAQPVPVH